MAPSRGVSYLVRARASFTTPQSRRFSDFVRAATDPANKSQVYISRSLDPYLNLSIEHYLLQKTPADSTVLFLYTNRKCVVIGRNQNPWVETHIPTITHDHDTRLVRRRSGGGTVFHDEGNVNYCVICPTPLFHRDTHAEMVVRALHKLGVENARVNERHDIVMDRTTPADNGDMRPLKVSGSAYKLTRLRSLHHGTCLLSSPNLKDISGMLWTPARRYIKARGVESVNSPVANVNVKNEDFEKAVVQEFDALYGAGEPVIVTGSVEDVPEIARGVDELTSRDWIYSQTPQFSLSTSGNDEYDVARDAGRIGWDDVFLSPPKAWSVNLTIRNGRILECEFKFNGKMPADEEQQLNKTLVGQALQNINDWEDVLGEKGWETGAAIWMNIMLGVPEDDPIYARTASS